MIAEARQDQPHYHKGEKRHYDHARGDQLQIVVDEEFAVLGRRLSLHLSQHQFIVAHGVIDQVWREYEASQLCPVNLGQVLLDDVGLPDRLVTLLYDNRYRNAADLEKATDDDLQELPGLGATYVAQIRTAVDGWIDRVAENATPQ